jgi:hypothetical protein
MPVFWFRTRIQIAVDLLRQSLVQVDPVAAVFDEWYMCKVILEFLANRGLTWISQAKSNRRILVNNEWINLTNFAKSLPREVFKRIDAKLEEKRYKWIYETEVTMKNVGLVKLVILKKRKNSKSLTFLVSNNTELTGSKILEYYKKRWSIEVFYRDCKQHLGLGEYQVRKLDAVVIHLVFFAYTLLKNAKRNPVLKTILKGLKSIGSACKRLKRWMLEILRGQKELLCCNVL